MLTRLRMQGFGIEFEGFSDALNRLRVEVTLGAFVCWALVSLKPNLQKLPIFNVELASAPTGTVYVLALSFFLYCVACFAVRFSREYGQYKILRRAREMERQQSEEREILDSTSSMRSFEDRARGFPSALRQRQDKEFIEPPVVQARVKTLISFDQVILAFVVPLVSACLLVMISLIHGSELFHDGVVFFAQQLWAAITLSPT